jgi:HSP20 family protein
MADKDLAKLNGETSNLPVRRESDYGLGFPSAFGEMDRWMNRWDQLFNSFLGRTGLAPWSDQEGGWAGRWGTFAPAVNVAETDQEVRVTAELPGMDENDIELSLQNGMLTIKGEKKEEHEDKGTNYYRSERSYGSFRRTISLPQEIDTGKVEANFKKGVLTVVLPKLPEPQSGARKISIKSEDSGK